MSTESANRCACDGRSGACQSGLKRRIGGVRIAILVALLGVLIAKPASAAISLVQDIDAVALKTTGTQLQLTVPAGGVGSGHSILLALTFDAATGTVSAVDSSGNAYAVDADVTNAGNLRTVVLSAHNVAALAAGDTITVTHPSVTARALSGSEFSGLLGSGTRDRVSTDTGNDDAPDSGTTATTSQADELLFGALGVNGRIGDSFTPTAPYTGLTRAGTTGGFSNTNVTINPEYRIVAATGGFSASGTNSSDREWAAAIVTYRAALANTPTTTRTATVTPTPTVTQTPSVTLTASVTPTASPICANPGKDGAGGTLSGIVNS
jgi:hypothetical protein